MKRIEIRDHRPKKQKKSKLPALIKTGLTFAVACGIGILIGRASNVIAPPAMLMADNSTVHVVEEEENLWDICRPLADARGMDIREVIYLISVNNGINQDASLKPGQRITLRF